MSNRDFTLPDNWAADAQTTIPVPPIPNVSYRDTALSAATARAGWPFTKKVDSAEWNQYVYIMSRLVRQMEQQGMLSWCPTTTYDEHALAFGSDGLLYESLQAANANKNPTTETAWWKKALPAATTSLAGRIQLATEAEVAAGTDAAKAITPATFRAAFTAQPYRYVLPGGLTLQGGYATARSPGNVYFPNPFTASIISIICTPAGGSEHDYAPTVNTWDVNGFVVYSEWNFFWQAIGY